ncbi:MAG TPA: Gfo/Idh/MocA family oxidoreductase [Nitrospira sp.]|nr:Gfo/Idh/MocA family oxidoreductase [Nitrospira sp.]
MHSSIGSFSTANLGIGLIGVGRHGSRYVQHLVRDLPDVTLAAVCRRSRGGVFLDATIPVYDDYRAMISDPRVHAVVVVTPPSLCYDICLAAVHARKPILIEKPLALNGSQARTMVAAASQSGVLLMTAHTLRFDPVIKMLREQIHTIEPLQSACLTTHIDTKPNVMSVGDGSVKVGALLELGIHLLDLVRFLTREDIIEVQCTMTPLPSVAPETQVEVRLRTSSSIACTLDIARVEVQRTGRAVWIGEKGTLTADWVSRSLTRTTEDGRLETWTLEFKPTVLATLQAFVYAIRTATVPPITGLDGCLAVEAADACYRSAANHGAVTLVGSIR